MILALTLTLTLTLKMTLLECGAVVYVTVFAAIAEATASTASAGTITNFTAASNAAASVFSVLAFAINSAGNFTFVPLYAVHLLSKSIGKTITMGQCGESHQQVPAICRDCGIHRVNALLGKHLLGRWQGWWRAVYFRRDAKGVHISKHCPLGAQSHGSLQLQSRTPFRLEGPKERKEALVQV